MKNELKFVNSETWKISWLLKGGMKYYTVVFIIFGKLFCCSVSSADVQLGLCILLDSATILSSEETLELLLLSSKRGKMNLC